MFDQRNINTGIGHINDVYKLALSVDCVILGYDEKSLKVLLIDCNTPPYEEYYSLLGELVEPNETLDCAAKRVVAHYTGLENIYLEEVKSYSKIERHPMGRVVTIAYYSLVKERDFKFHDLLHKGLKWVDVNEVKELAFDHKQIFDECLSKLKERLRDQPIGFNLLPKKFTLNQLQNLYEVVLGIELDKRNFRRKIMSLGLLVDLDEMQQDVAHRPAKLFSFDYEKYHSKKDHGFNFEI